MIRVLLKDQYTWSVILPHEINNEFLFHVDQYTQKNVSLFGYLNIGMNDFGADVEFTPEKLNQLYLDFDKLEKYLDEIIKIIPLPKKIGGWEWYYPGYISVYKEGVNEFKRNFPDYSEKQIQDNIDSENMIQQPTPFTKQDMLLIISLIKKKILEAKEKNETLVFSGD